MTTLTDPKDKSSAVDVVLGIAAKLQHDEMLRLRDEIAALISEARREGAREERIVAVERGAEAAHDEVVRIYGDAVRARQVGDAVVAAIRAKED